MPRTGKSSMWPISFPHGISKKTLRMFATSRRILSNIEELLGGMRASFSRTKIYRGWWRHEHHRDTSVKVIPVTLAFRVHTSIHFHRVSSRYSLHWEIAAYFFIKISFQTKFFSPSFSPIPAFSIKQTNVSTSWRESARIRNDGVPDFGEETGVVCSSHTWGYHFTKHIRKHKLTYRFLKLISIVIPELLERRVGTCRFP